MNYKKLNLLAFVAIILFLIPNVMASPLDTFFNGVNTVINSSIGNEAVSFLIFFIFFMAIFWIGTNKTAAILGWTDAKLTTALKALSIIVAVALSVGVISWQRSSGFNLITEAGALGAIMLIFVPLMLLVYVFYKSSPKPSKMMPYFVAIGFILIYTILNKFFPDFGKNLGDYAGVIDFFFGASVVVLFIGIILFIWNNIINPLFSLKTKTPLTDQELKDTQTAIKQKSELKQLEQERKSAERLRADERKTRRGIRNYDRDLRKAANILGNLHQAASKRDVNEISGKRSFFDGELKELEKLKVQIGGYAGIISKILAETINDVGSVMSVDDQKKLLSFKNLLMKNYTLLEAEIAKITSSVNNIYTKKATKSPITPADFNDLIAAIQLSSKTITQIHQNAMGALALEAQLRNKLFKS